MKRRWRGRAVGAVLVAAAAACSSSTVVDVGGDDGGSGSIPFGDASGGGGDDASFGGGDDATSATDSGGGRDTGVTDAGVTDAGVTDAGGGSDAPSDAPRGDSASGANGKLVINEVDYDEVNSDNAEFLEVYNPDATNAVPLAGLAVIFVAGGGQGEYGRVDLGQAGTLPPHGYVVIAAPGVDVSDAGGALVIRFANATNNIQNGRANPAAVAILDTATSTLVDALSYGGSLTTPYDFVEGTPTTATDSNDAGGSLIRNPNGTDTGNAASDWAFTTTLTPGTANVLTP